MTDDIPNHDLEQIFKHLPERPQNDVKHDAYDQTLDEWRDQRPDDLDALEAANDDAESRFEWDITLGFEQHNRDELTPYAGVEPTDEREVYDLANDFGWDYVANVREEVYQLVENSEFTAKELLALIIWSDDQFTDRDGATLMDYSSAGVFSGKASRARGKIEKAETTLEVAEAVTGGEYR